MTQTAVEWLRNEIEHDHYKQAKTSSEWKKVFNQAKQMEKEQIKNTWADGFKYGFDLGKEVDAESKEELENRFKNFIIKGEQ